MNIIKKRFLSALKFAGVTFLFFNFAVVLYVIIHIFILSFEYRDNKEGLFENKQGLAQIQQPINIQVDSPIQSDNYDVIDPSQSITSSEFYICKNDVKTYMAPEEREEWLSGEIENGTPISFSSISNAHWALISVDPTIEYVDMVNVCRKDKNP
jgi:hypothetical protein